MIQTAKKCDEEGVKKVNGPKKIWSSGHALAPERFFRPALSFCAVSCML